MIVAPPATVSAWRNESGRLLAASATPGLPAAVVEVLTHASRILMASAINAAPDGPPLFDAGLRRLLAEIRVGVGPDLAQAAGVEESTPCPLPQGDGSAFTCPSGPCGEEERRKCAEVAREIGERPDRAGGGLAADLDALVADDQARRDGGQS